MPSTAEILADPVATRLAAELSERPAGVHDDEGN
jgi:hypothetical protein